MRAHRFFVQEPLATGQAVWLAPEQARQARNVLRLRVGDTVELLDGSGLVGVARLEHIERDCANAIVETLVASAALPINLTVGLALLRGDRFEIAIQKLVEIGASSIVPLAAQHCVVSYAVDREWDRRLTRLQRIAMEAAEQSERSTIPQIARPVSVEAFLAKHSGISLALVERSEAAEQLMTVSFDRDVAVLVGPEGGWSKRELQTIALGARTVSLGPLILRAETAAIVTAGALMQRAWARNTHQEEG
ncbi:MAG TPA: 16S rRNA (uracil(1498)-N(3))-methyltransferase [Chloroflexi bacterium]|nr:16S rRNA (uracil(1498)-N(3))-methyltransferase [Chloroflexota bacterium]